MYLTGMKYEFLALFHREQMFVVKLKTNSFEF
jgi:hypothetical protein